MGNCLCCDAQTPCASAEEKSGLLTGKTTALPDTGQEGLFLDSPTSDGRKASMDEIKEEEMKDEQIKAEEKTSVTAQVRQGENTPNMPQKNGVVQKESVSMEAAAPPSPHQTSAGGSPDPRPRPLSAAEAPDVPVMGTVVTATPQERTAAVAEERRPSPLSAAPEVTEAPSDITSSTADPVCEGAGGRGNSQGLCEEGPPPAPLGSSPEKISTTESASQPPPSLQATPTRAVTSVLGCLEEGSSALDLKVCPPDSQVCVEEEACPIEQVCSLNTQVCGNVLGNETVLDVSPGPDSTGPTGDLPSVALDPETTCPADTNQKGPTPMEVEEAELHPDHPMALRDTQEALEKPQEEERSMGSRVLNDPLPLRENQDTDHDQEMVDVQEEVVREGGTEEEKEEAAERFVDDSISMEKPEWVEGEAEREPEPLTAPPTTDAGSDEGEGSLVKVKAQQEEKTRGGEKEVVSPADLYNVEDLYSAKVEDSSPSSLEFTSMMGENCCSLAPMVDLLSYSMREWKGNTTKSALIREGYQQMIQFFGGVRRVRGDNYCALRATLFQVLSQTTQPPDWLYRHDVTTLPEELDGPDGLLSQWSFPFEQQSGDGKRDATQRLKGYIELLRKTWRSAADCPTADDRRQMCEAVFQGGEEELGLLEALKLLMLGRAAELHRLMEQGQEVPVFCWLLFARDTSPCPRTFLTNHLRHVGVSGGLEQVEMFLLGYALRCTIQVFRLYMWGTEEFRIYYPDDHLDDWPSVSLVTEDDRHYNVPVAAPETVSR